MKKYIKQNKGFFISYGVIIGMILLLTLLKINNATFFLLSLFLNIMLIQGIKEIQKVLKIEFTLKQKIYIICAILAIYLFYSLSLLTRNFVYYWDYSCYYNIQLESMEHFLLGPLSGIRYFIGSTWSGDYGNFLSFIPQVFFQITNHTENSFIASYVLVFTPYLILSFCIALRELCKKWNLKEEDKLLAVGLLTLVLSPIFHATAIYGQPDFMGLSFVWLIIALTISYDFKKVDIPRLFLLFVSTYFLIISRRWYLYWIVTYYLCYGIGVLCNSKNKKETITILKHASIYIAICAILIVGTLFPLIKNVLGANLSSSYAFYKVGGFASEFMYQKNHLGILTLAILLLGIGYGLYQKETRKQTILSLLQYLLMIFLFTRIQNMGLHHTLILLSLYLFWMILFLKNTKKELLYFLYVGILLLNFTGSMIEKNSILWSDIPLHIPYQEDYQSLGEVVEWIEEKAPNEKFYMIPHNNRYNPDKLRNYKAPDSKVKSVLPYGSAILGTQAFPIELLEANYVITTDPFEYVSIEKQYEEVFESCIEDHIYELEKEFDMKNGFKMIIYKRVKDLTIEEIDRYRDALEETTKDFPQLYVEKIEEYKNRKFT